MGDVVSFFGCELSSAELAQASFPMAQVALVEIAGADQLATDSLPILRDFRMG